MDEDFFIVGDDIQDIMFVNCCKYNDGVVCIRKERKPYQCEKCGWNPKVSNRRKRKRRREMDAQE